MSNTGLNLSAPIVTPPGVGTNLCKYSSFKKAQQASSPVDGVSLDVAGLSPLQLHLGVGLGQPLVRGKVASGPGRKISHFRRIEDLRRYEIDSLPEHKLVKPAACVN